MIGIDSLSKHVLIKRAIEWKMRVFDGWREETGAILFIKIGQEMELLDL
jgi:hypothetical protein